MAANVSSEAGIASDVVKATGPARKSLEDMIIAQETQPQSGASASAGASASQSIDSPAPSQPAIPPVPVRQVRSSWLTKALGTDKVPITAATATSTVDRDTFRKSFAATSQKAPQVDFSSFRKSLVPAGTLKRKSEVDMDEDKDDDEEARPEKVIKVDVPATTPGAAPAAPAASTSASVPVRPTFDRQISREMERERESIFPVRPTSAPHAVVVPVPATTPGPANTGTADAQEHASADRHRSDIHKVTKALDELRERAREKEAAAKAKAMTLAASTGPKRTSTAAPPNTGTGFLRGLGSLGVGLGRSLGLGGQGQKSAEDEALRLQRELEEERRASLEAKEELARLMGEMEKEKDKDKAVPTTVSAVSSGSDKQNMEDDVQAEQDELDPDTDEEREVTEQIEMEIEQTEFVTAPQASLAAPTVSPPGRPRPAMQSTTPSGTPPRKIPAREAPALHARHEKHAHPSPAKEAQRPTRAAEPAPAEVLVRHPSDEHVVRPSKAATAAAQRSAPAASPGAQSRAREAGASTQDYLVDEEMEGIDDEQEIMRRPLQPQTSKARIQHSSSSSSLAPSQFLGASISSQATTIGSLSQASTVAGKMLGVKPSVAPVKSVQLAAAAAKKVSPESTQESHELSLC
jgi:hypothetical protein